MDDLRNILLLLVALLVFALVYLLVPGLFFSSPPFQLQENQLVVGNLNKGTEAKYYRAGPTKIEGTVFASFKVFGLDKELGVRRQLFLLTHHDYDEYVRSYKSRGACPAAFVNPRLRPVRVVTNNASHDRWLSWLTQGERVRLTGESLTLASVENKKYISFDVGSIRGDANSTRWLLLQSH